MISSVIDLINTVTIHNGDVNLLEELMGNDGEETTLPINFPALSITLTLSSFLSLVKSLVLIS